MELAACHSGRISHSDLQCHRCCSAGKQSQVRGRRSAGCDCCYNCECRLPPSHPLSPAPSVTRGQCHETTARHSPVGRVATPSDSYWLPETHYQWRNQMIEASQKRSATVLPSSSSCLFQGDATRVCPPQQKVNTSTNNMQRWLPQRSVPATTCCGRCRGDRPSLSSTYRWREGHMTCPVFAYVANEESHGAGPNIDYTVTALRPHTSSKSNPLNTPANQRARAGFIYWWFPRPKPTKYGCYSMGSYKTTLGLASASRS